MNKLLFFFCNTNKKYRFILVLYLAIIIAQLLFVPYKRVETRISEQNVPHEITLHYGYDFICNTLSDKAYRRNQDGTTRHNEINYIQLVFQLLITGSAGLTALVIFRKKNKLHNTSLHSNNEYDQGADPAYILQRYKLLQQQNIELINLIKKCDLYDAIENFKEKPQIDLNSLVFADNEIIASVMKKYERDMEYYTLYKIFNQFNAISDK